MSKGWDNATLKKLKSLMGKGLSTSEIGKRLGLSKNAVVGKLNRLGWNLKAGGAPAEKEAPMPKKAAAKKEVKAPASKKTAATSKPAKTAAKAPAKKATGPKAATKKAAEKPAAKTAAKKESAPKAAKEKATKESAPKSTSKASSKNLAMHQRIIQHSLEMANLKPNQCRWPIGDPDSENFHFCGETVFVGKPYCYEHCKQAYQFAPPKKK